MPEDIQVVVRQMVQKNGFVSLGRVDAELRLPKRDPGDWPYSDRAYDWYLEGYEGSNDG